MRLRAACDRPIRGLPSRSRDSKPAAIRTRPASCCAMAAKAARSSPKSAQPFAPADALVMARSGLERIGMVSRIAHDFSVQEMLPSVGQGIVAVECAEKDWLTRERLARIEDDSSRLCAEAEREVLWVLNGHCNSPIAGHATIAGGDMTLTAAVLDETGTRFIEATRTAAADRPRELGRAVGLELPDKGAAEIIARNRPDEH